MRVLVTRPIDDAHETAALLKARGHEPIVAPLLSVNYHDGHPLHLDGVQALLFTSANGARAFARRTSLRDFTVFAVGSQTAEAARAAGFTDVRNADGDATTLANAVHAGASPDKGVLLHAAGAEAEGRLAAQLTAAGFTVRTEVLYDVPTIAELPEAARAALEANAVDAVLLYSARSAQVFADTVTKAALATDALIACCISEAAAKPLVALRLREIRIATRPTQAALLDCLR
ncbi:MAG: uroporphyrinogen-III synthase [Alphaproteobacteria bacterium]|nr:uroporphyrinogen-III synthase [Alphaproteobacteria bacterium]MBV9903810.1 uroporphyrinogen-III synthase [Alphaproteobacteria bacterium]